MATDYTTQADIVANLKKVEFNSNTAVTDTELAEYISEESATIDFYINQKYELPITNADALKFLKGICNKLVVYRVKTTLQPKTALPQAEGNAQQDIVGTAPYNNAIAMLKDIRDSEGVLPGEEPKGKVFFSSSAVDNDYPTVFKAEDQQW